MSQNYTLLFLIKYELKFVVHEGNCIKSILRLNVPMFQTLHISYSYEKEFRRIL